METLPEEIQYTIYKYKHQLEYKHIIDELKYNKKQTHEGPEFKLVESLVYLKAKLISFFITSK